MKATLLLLAPVALLVSCAPNQSQVQAPVAPAANTGNQYGVPGVPTAPGSYIPTAPPYQQVDPINPPATSIPPVPEIPTYTPPTASTPSSLNGNVHTITKGDSLWGLSRKYNTSVDAIRTANGLEGDMIRTGDTLIIPGR